MKDSIHISKPQTENAGKTNKVTINDMIETVTDLSNILTQETNLLKQRKMAFVEELQDRKEQLTKRLEIFRKIAKKDRRLLGEFSAQKQKELENIFGMFEKILKENHQELLKARLLNNKVVEAVAHAVKDNLKRKESYGMEGNINRTPVLPSITYNENI